MAKQTVLDFLMHHGFFETASVSVTPLVTETDAPVGYARSFQPDAVVQCGDRTLFVMAVQNSEPVSAESLAERLEALEDILCSPYRLTIPVICSEVVIIFDSDAVQTAFEGYLLESSYGYEFPLYLVSGENWELRPYPKEKGAFRRAADRLRRILERTLEGCFR